MSVQRSKNICASSVDNEEVCQEIDSITETLDSGDMENATLQPIQRKLENSPRTEIAQVVSILDHEDSCAKQNDAEGILTNQGNNAHSTNRKVTDNDALVIEQRHNITEASNQPNDIDEETYLQPIDTDLDVEVIQLDLLEDSSSAARDDSLCFSCISEDYPAKDLAGADNFQVIESGICDETQCVDYDPDRSVKAKEETCIQSEKEIVLISELEMPSIDLIEGKNDTQTGGIEDVQGTFFTLDVRDGISTCAIVDDQQTDNFCIQTTNDSKNLPCKVKEHNASKSLVSEGNVYTENAFEVEQDACINLSVMDNCITETIQPASNKIVHLLLPENEAANTVSATRNTQFVPVCNNNSAVREVSLQEDSCFEKQGCTSLNFDEGKYDEMMTKSDAQNVLDDDDGYGDNDDVEWYPGGLKHANQHLQVFAEVKEEFFKVNPESRKHSDHCIHEQLAIDLASFYERGVKPWEKTKIIRGHEGKENMHLITPAYCPNTQIQSNEYTVDTRQQKMLLHKHRSLCEDDVKNLEKHTVMESRKKTKSRIQFLPTNRGLSAPNEVAKDLPDKSNRYSKPTLNTHPWYQGCYRPLHHMEDLHTRRRYLCNEDSRIEVKKLFHEEHVAFVPKSMSVEKAVSQIKTSLGLGKWHNLDLYWENQLLHEHELLKDLSGNNCLHVVQRPVHRQAPRQYRTDDADMTNPFEDDDYRVSMSCRHAITPSNLYDYCWSKINDGLIDVTCPAITNQQQPPIQCGKIWDFKEFSTKACLSTDEMCLFQVVLFQNWIERNRDVHKCPNCGAYIQSMCNSNGYFICTICTQRYCIKCYRPWRNSSIKRCENIDCVQTREILQHQLNSSGVKTIVEVPRCPVLRACPRCCTMIQHDGDACKHMDCPNKMCRIQFCFICLAVKEDKYYWPESCHGAFFKCKVAPIQQVL